MSQPSGSCTNVIIVSAPSGTGKTVLCRALMEEVGGLVFSISCTTRPMRRGDVDGENYYFTDVARFDEMQQRGEFLENFPVYGKKYGSPRAFLDLAYSTGKDLLLDIDVKGAALLRGTIGHTISVFIMPPGFQELEQRLRDRQDLQDDVIRRRLDFARGEVQGSCDYDYVIVNRTGDGGLQDAKKRLNSIVRWERARRQGTDDNAEAAEWREIAEKCRRTAVAAEIQPILETFK